MQRENGCYSLDFLFFKESKTAVAEHGPLWWCPQPCYPSISCEPQPPTDNRPSSTSNDYLFLSTNKGRPQPHYSPIMPMKGYEYGCHGLFIRFQTISELEYHPPTDSIPFPHYTSSFNDFTPYEPGDRTQTSKTAKTPTPLSTRPRQHTNTPKVANPPVPRSRRPVARSRPAASSTKEESERTIKYRARLALVNGIKTPSNGTVTKVPDQFRMNHAPRKPWSSIL